MENKIFWKTFKNIEQDFICKQFVKLNKYITCNPKYIKLYLKFYNCQNKNNYYELVNYLNSNLEEYMLFLKGCRNDFPFIVNLSFATDFNKIIYTNESNNLCFCKFKNNKIDLLNTTEYKSLIQVNSKENGLIISDDFLSLGSNSQGTTIFSSSGFTQKKIYHIDEKYRDSVVFMTDYNANIYYSLYSGESSSDLYILINNDGKFINNGNIDTPYTYIYMNDIINYQSNFMCGGNYHVDGNYIGTIWSFQYVDDSIGREWSEIKYYGFKLNKNGILIMEEIKLLFSRNMPDIPFSYGYDNGWFLFFYRNEKSNKYLYIFNIVENSLSFVDIKFYSITSSTQKNITYTYILKHDFGIYLEYTNEKSLSFKKESKLLYNISNFSKDPKIATCGENSFYCTYVNNDNDTIILYWAINEDGLFINPEAPSIINTSNYKPILTFDFFKSYPKNTNSIPNIYNDSNIGLLSQ